MTLSPIGTPSHFSPEDNSKNISHKSTFNKRKKSRQKAPYSTEGFEGYYKKTTKKDGQTNTTFHAIAGPITGLYKKLGSSYLGDPQYDEETISNWIPHMSMSVADDNTGRSLNASEIKTKMQGRWLPSYFVNPMQDLDYVVIEAMTRQTFIGPLIDALVKFIVGKGFKPELELINPSGDHAKDEKLREENQNVIDALMQIDKQISENDDNSLDVSFTEKISALISGTVTYNRAALIFNYDTPIVLDDKKYSNIPSGLTFAHPRDLGIIEVSPKTQRLISVQWRNAFFQVPTKDMIYMWNPLISAKTRNSWFYGDSMILPMLDAARVIKKNIGVNFPAMAEATWAGLFILGIRPQGQTQEQKRKEYTTIANSMVPGGPDILMEEPENYRVDSIDYNPKVTEFKDLTEFLLRYCVATLGLPQSLFYDESQSNRATMIGKILLARDTIINPMREWIGRAISQQWYQRWFKEIYSKTKPELYKQFRIKVAFSDINIEEWFDKIDAVIELDSRKQLKDEAFGEFAGIDNYSNKTEENAEVTPKQKGLDLGDGKTLSIKERKEQLAAKTIPSQRFKFTSKKLASLVANSREDSFELPSSVIGMVTWFEDETMTISINGTNYNYCDIPKFIFTRFKNASSKGLFFNHNIRDVHECA